MVLTSTLYRRFRTPNLLNLICLRRCGFVVLFLLTAAFHGQSQNILSPETGATNQNYSQVVLQWADTTHSYRVLIGTDSLSWGIVDTVVSGSYLVITKLSPSTTYFWKLQTIGDTSNVSSQTSWFTTGHYLTFQNFKFIPAIDSINFVSELSSQTITFTDSIDIGKTALVLCDVWASAADSNVVNIVTMLDVARKHNIPVFLFNHNGPLYPTVVLKPWDINANISAIPDTMLSQKGYTTLLYAGGDASECILFTRPISINTLTLKVPNTYKIVGIKDCIISWSQLAYNWGINAIETKYQTTLMATLAAALGDTVNTLIVQRPSLLATINTDSAFGTVLNPSQTALVVVNAWNYFPNAGWLARIRNNNRNNIAPLIKWARSIGIRVYHAANGQPIDSSCLPLGNELVVNDKNSLYSYIRGTGVKKIIFCGNLINTANVFAPMDAWGMTKYPTGFNNVPGFFSSRLLSDCFTVFETPGTLATETNKYIYLERSSTEPYDTMYLVSSLATLTRNIPLKIISTPLFVAHEDSVYRDTVVSQSAFLDSTLRYTFIVKPSWLKINNLSGIIYGTPGAANVGDTTVMIQVRNGAGRVTTQSYTLTVLQTNHNPKIITAADSTATEDSPYKYRVIAVDKDTALYGDVIRYRLSIKPSWLTIDSVAGLVTGLPSGINARDTVVAIQAYDNKGGAGTQQFTLHVVHVNHVPKILSQPVTIAKQDSLYRYRMYATDQDSALWGDRLTYMLQVYPYWLTADSVTGIVSGTPHALNVGDTVVTVQVSDGKGGTATQSYPLHVAHTNHSPVIKTGSLPPAVEDTLYQTRVYASDQDSALFGDVVHYKLSLRPVWLKIDSVSGIITGTASGINAQDTTVTATAYDGKGGSSSQSYAIHVVHTNHAPVIVSIAVTHAAEDTLYRYAVWGSDQDSALFGDRVHYHLTTRPSWITIDSVLGLISGTPHAQNVGDTVVTVQVSDGKGGTATQSYPLTITHTNHPPVIMQLPDTLAREDTLYQSKVWATDQDSALYGDRVHYALLNKPSWITIDSVLGKLSGTPIGASAVDTILNLQAYDGKGGLATKRMTLHVLRVNHPPVILSTALTIAQEDSVYKYKVTAADQDTVVGDSISYSLIAHPSWLTFNAVTHCFSGTPRAVDVGDTLFSFKLTDRLGAFATQTDTLHVHHTNHTPQFVGTVTDTTVVEDQSYRASVWATDQDSALFGDKVHYRLLKPAWMAIDSTTGIFGGTPHVQNVFDSAVVLQAYDNHGGMAQQQYTLHITRINHSPTLSSSPVFTAHEDTLYRYQVVAYDPDTLIGQVLAYTLTQKPSWLSVSSGGLVSGIPRGINVGDTTVTVKVSDGNGGVVNQSYHLAVIHTNHNPYFVSAIDSMATEDSLYLYAATARDQDSALFGDKVHYKLITKPSWIAIDSVTGLLSGIPSGKNVRDTVVCILAYDNSGGTATQQFILRVTHVNHPPQFDIFPADSAVEDSMYYTVAGATDQDSLLWGDIDSFGILQSPSWLVIDSVKGIIHGIPRLVRSSSSLASQTVNARVQQILDKTKTIKHYAAKPKTKRAQILGIAGTNIYLDFPVTIAVWDTRGGASEYSYDLTVRHTNHPPGFFVFPDSTAVEDSLYTTVVRASDIDSAMFGDIVHYRFVSKPPWISIDSVTGIITGTPHGPDLVDTTKIIAQAYDGKGGVTSYQYGVHIRHVNHPPVFVSPPVTNGVEDSLYVYRASAIDSDSLLWGDRVSYAVVTAPSFLSIDSTSGIIAGIPALVLDSLAMKSGKASTGKQSRGGVMHTSVVKFIPAVSRAAKKSVAGARAVMDSSQYRTFPVSISASDGKGGIALQSFTLAVLHTDHAPVFTSAPDSVATEDSLYRYQYSVYDRDAALFGDTMTVTTTIRPSWLHHDSVQHVLTGIPYGRLAADTIVELVVADNHGLSTTQHFIVHVANVNHPPQILSAPDTIALADSMYRYVVTAVDSDAIFGRDSISYKELFGPQWLHMKNDTLIGLPVNANAGDSMVAILVSDKHGSTVQQVWKIAVLPMVLPPTAFQLVNTFHADSLTINYGKALTLNWQPSHGHDPGDTVRYALKLWGGRIDTTISGIADTVFSSSSMMKKLLPRTHYAWTVSAAVNGRTAVWSKDTVQFFTSGSIVYAEGQASQIPQDYVLYQNYPNPFNPSTTIRYGIPELSNVSVKVYNILGQVVATLVHEVQQPQFYEYRWNPNHAASGVYIVVINAQSLISPTKTYRSIKKALYVK
ncbi:MAG TPA: putative Ig domain-containing protein [Bacteroidota bacterium]|nr:putative Ig domain-containing protein [Bacteroidota bacterium]